MAKFAEFNPRNLGAKISAYALDPAKTRRFLDAVAIVDPNKPHIADFQPTQGHGGTAMVILGSGFADERESNRVIIGGKKALVVEASPERLFVITSPFTVSGDVEVTVDGKTAVGDQPFVKLPWPKPDSGEDGAPYAYAGRGPGDVPAAGTLPSTGTARILVVACNPTDLVPPNATTARQDIVDRFDDVETFYDQASYGALSVQADVTTFVSLLQDSNYYHRTNGANGYPNIDASVLGQLMAECAQGAVDQGFDLDDYALMVASVYLPGLTVRAWGGWSSSNFAYDDGAGTTINLTTANPVSLVAQRHDANWGRSAHEIGHALLDPGLVLGEDVYRSDLVDPDAATATRFAMMGSHDTHPLFSAYNMKSLGWYSSANMALRNWDRNPYSEEFDIVAHDLTENTNSTRIHLLEIRISSGLSYFVEVRQRPDASSATPAVFDESIPLSTSSTVDGGVVVTKVISGELNVNQQTRLITLLHEQERILVTGESAEDPLRTIRFSVVNDNIQARPRVCRVRVEWAQEISDTPDADFDLRIDPWGPGWETEDIWVDRMPYGNYDFTDSSGNPTGNGDEPRPMEINRFYARIHNDGTVTANSVKVTHYVVTPPGVGDNGNWAPLATRTIASIAPNSFDENYVNWVPIVGEHTCLKVAIHQQLGEELGGNNQAQENIFNFQPPASSIAEPIQLTVAVRNPLDERAQVFVSLENVPVGYFVYFPHRWVWLEPKGEKKLDLLVVPLFNPEQAGNSEWVAAYAENTRYKISPRAAIRLYGRIPHVYRKELEITGAPASWLSPIGGVLALVEPKRRGKIQVDDKIEANEDGIFTVRGCVEPRIRCQTLRVDMTRPDGSVSSVITDTDESGCFLARFEYDNRADCPSVVLKHKKVEMSVKKPTVEISVDQRVNCPSNDNSPVETPDKENGICVYSFQAHIFNASQVAPTDSNIVRFIVS